MVETALPIVLALVLAGASFYSERTLHLARRHFPKIVSLAAGVLSALVFASFFPLLATFSPAFPGVWLTLLAGFVVYHLAEKRLYQHVWGNKLQKELAELDVAGFFVDHFITGLALALVFVLQLERELVAIFIVFMLHAVTSSLTVREIKQRFPFGTAGDVVLASGVVIGALVGIALALSGYVLAVEAVFAFSVGVLVYLVVRHVIPSKEKGSPAWFLLGLAVTLAVLLV